MVLYKVYSQEHRIRYLTYPCSSAIIFQTCCLFLTFLPPLFTGYFTSGFYYKELTYTEQPTVTFLQKYDLIIDSLSALRFCSSDSRLNNHFSSSLVPCTLTSFMPRYSNDGQVIDQENITLNVIFPSAISSSVLNLWLLFQYQLNRFPLINMETLGLIQLNVPSSLSANTAVTVYGQLSFHQREPLVSYKNYSSIQGPIIDYGSYSIVPSFDNLLDNYTNRTYFTTFDQQYVQWASIPSTDNSTVYLLTIKVAVNIPLQIYRYVPSFWTEFRWAWIQYFTGLLPFFYVANKAKEFVFSNGIVRTVVGKSP